MLMEESAHFDQKAYKLVGGESNTTGSRRRHRHIVSTLVVVLLRRVLHAFCHLLARCGSEPTAI